MYRFSEFLADKGYDNEQSVLLQLPKLDMVQQAKLDMSLHNNAVSNGTFGPQSQQLVADKNWKQKFIDIVQGREVNPEIIQQTIDSIESDLESHRNRLADRKTGSYAWHQAWIAVYERWLQELHQLLGAINGTKGRKQRSKSYQKSISYGIS